MVSEDNLVLAMLLDKIKVSYDDFTKDYHDRMIIQWKIYLLEKLGFIMSDSFYWGMIGVYSHTLNDKIYECLIEMKPNDLDGYAFKGIYQKYLDNFLTLEMEKPDTIDTYKWWLLLSSICFWKEKDNEWNNNLNRALKPEILTHQEVANACLIKHMNSRKEVD